MWQEGEAPEIAAQSHSGMVNEPIIDDGGPTTKDPCDNYNPPDNTFEMDICFNNPNQLEGSTCTEYVCEQMEVDAQAKNNWCHQVKTSLDNPGMLYHMWIYVVMALIVQMGTRLEMEPISVAPSA